MGVNYNKLFHLLIKKEMSNADLQRQAGFSVNICGVDDILDFVSDGDQ